MTDKTVAFGDGTLTARASESTVDIANNRSLVLVSLILSTSGTWYEYHDGSANVKVNGTGIGFASGSTTDQPSTGGTKTIISNAGVWVTHDANGQATVTFSGHLTWPQFPMDVDTGNGSLTLSNIVQAPSAPSAVTATRVSDTQITVGWTNNSAAHHEYASQNVYRSTDGGGYALIASGISASATTYSDTGTSANHKYTYKVEAVNAAGSAQSTASSAAWTTPGTPTGCTATKQPNNDVVVTWTNHVNYGDTDWQTDVYHSTDGGSSFTYLDTVAANVASYTHVAPSTATTHTYRVVAVHHTPDLYSAPSSNSNTVTLLSTANPPTGLSPSGVALDAADAITFTWTHNPTDGTPQSKYQLQYSTDGGSTWTTVGPTVSSVSSYTLPAATLANGATVTWRVETAGQNGTLSGYSANATFTTSAKPTVTISSPGASVNTSHPTISWTYFQAQGSAQAAWQAQLYDNSNNLLETISGTTESSGTFATPVADGGTYTVKVAVTSAAGLSSAQASQTFTVTYLPPAAVSVSASYDSPSGCMVLALTGSAYVVGVTEPIATVDILRQINGGAWVTFATGIVLDAVTLTATVLDTAPTINGTNTYKAIARSSLPSSAESGTVDVTTAETGWAFLSTGDGFATVVRLKSTPQFGADASRSRALYHFAGRSKPVALSGEATDLVLTVAARLFGGASTAEEFESIATTTGVVLWREPTGRRVFGALGKVSIKRTTKIFSDVSFGLTEVDYTE